VSLAFLVVEDHSLFSQSKHVALRTNYKIKIAQHKHTIHSNIIKQDKQNFVIHLFRSLDKEERYEAWLASYGFHRLDG
jgi:hypothetical protein